MSILSRFKKVNWIADILTPLAVILMEVFWLYPWLVFIGKVLGSTFQKTPLSLLSLIFLLGFSYIATKYFPETKMADAVDSDKYHCLRIGSDFPRVAY